MLVEAQEKISKNEQTVNINSSSLKKQQKPCKKQECEKTMWGGRGRVRERCQGNALGSPGDGRARGRRQGSSAGMGRAERRKAGDSRRGGEGRQKGQKEGREGGSSLWNALSSRLLGVTRTPHSHCARCTQTRELFISFTSTTQEKNMQAEDRERRQ